MRMTGSWHVYPRRRAVAPARRQARLALTCGDRVAVCFNAPVVELLRPGAERRPPGPRRPRPRRARRARSTSTRSAAGPGPARPTTALGELLLDQRVVAGIGNIWRCEALFLEGHNPWTPLSGLDRRRARRPGVDRRPAHAGWASESRTGVPDGRVGLPAHRPALPPVPHAGAVPPPGRAGPHRLLVPDLPARPARPARRRPTAVRVRPPARAGLARTAAVSPGPRRPGDGAPPAAARRPHAAAGVPGLPAALRRQRHLLPRPPAHGGGHPVPGVPAHRVVAGRGHDRPGVTSGPSSSCPWSAGPSPTPSTAASCSSSPRCCPAATSAALAAQRRRSTSPRLWPLYVLGALTAGLWGVDLPTRNAMIPAWSRREQFPAAAALGQILFQIGQVAGPGPGRRHHQPGRPGRRLLDRRRQLRRRLRRPRPHHAPAARGRRHPGQPGVDQGGPALPEGPAPAGRARSSSTSTPWCSACPGPCSRPSAPASSAAGPPPSACSTPPRAPAPCSAPCSPAGSDGSAARAGP